MIQSNSQNLWSARGMVVRVRGPGDAQASIRLSQPFARVGADHRAEVRLPEGNLLPCHLYLHATEQGIFCLGLSKSAPSGWLTAGVRTKVGPYRIHVAFADDGPPPHTSAIELQKRRPGAGPAPRIKITGPCGRRQPSELVLDRPLTVVGRRPPSHLRLAHRTVSPLHCVLYWSADVLWAIDLLSGNGIQLDEQATVAAAWQADQRLSLGAFELRRQKRREPVAVRANSLPRPSLDALPPSPADCVPSSSGHAGADDYFHEMGVKFESTLSFSSATAPLGSQASEGFLSAVAIHASAVRHLSWAKTEPAPEQATVAGARGQMAAKRLAREPEKVEAERVEAQRIEAEKVAPERCEPEKAEATAGREEGVPAQRSPALLLTQPVEPQSMAIKGSEPKATALAKPLSQEIVSYDAATTTKTRAILASGASGEDSRHALPGADAANAELLSAAIRATVTESPHSQMDPTAAPQDLISALSAIAVQLPSHPDHAALNKAPPNSMTAEASRAWEASRPTGNGVERLEQELSMVCLTLVKAKQTAERSASPTMPDMEPLVNAIRGLEARIVQLAQANQDIARLVATALGPAALASSPAASSLEPPQPRQDSGSSLDKAATLPRPPDLAPSHATTGAGQQLRRLTGRPEAGPHGPETCRERLQARDAPANQRRQAATGSVPHTPALLATPSHDQLAFKDRHARPSSLEASSRAGRAVRGSDQIPELPASDAPGGLLDDQLLERLVKFKTKRDALVRRRHKVIWSVVAAVFTVSAIAASGAVKVWLVDTEQEERSVEVWSPQALHQAE